MVENITGKIPPYLKNRYSIVVLFFFVWMLFFDQNDIITQIKLKKRLNKIEKQKEYYNKEINRTQNELDNLLNDDAKLEKFAREKYLMKKKDEDLFIITNE